MKSILVKYSDDFAPNGERLRLYVGCAEDINQLKSSISKFSNGVEIIEEKEFNDLAVLIQES